MDRLRGVVASIVMVSGGRAGAELAALDWAISRGLEHRGWCASERKSEDGPIPLKYRLRETDSPEESEALEWNVRDSDATILFSLRKDPPLAALEAVRMAEALRKPWLRLNHGTPCDPPARLAAFLRTHHVSALHVTGSRAVQEPGICEFVRSVLDRAWAVTTEGLVLSNGRAGSGMHGAGEASPLRDIPVLRTARLVLRPFTSADASCVQVYLSDPSVADATIHLPHPYPPDEAAHWIAGHAEALEEGVWHWAVTLGDGSLVGAVTLLVSPENGRGTLGYWIGKSHRGQGIASEALRRVIGFGFAHLGLYRIEGAHLAEAVEAGRVMEAAGMVTEGVLRGHLLKEGRHHDVAIHGILNPLGLASNPTNGKAAMATMAAK